MSENFFDSKYITEPSRGESLIGICDPEGESPAYTTVEKDGEDVWCAEICNPKNVPIQFVPVDKNITFYDEKGDLVSSCDGMMLVPSEELLCFVELKNQKKEWITQSISQLEQTLNMFNANHDYKDFAHRRAYACNAQHRSWQPSHRELQQRFFQKTHFRLHLEWTIKI